MVPIQTWAASSPRIILSAGAGSLATAYNLFHHWFLLLESFSRFQCITRSKYSEVWDCSDDEDGEVEPHQNPKSGWI